MEKEYDFSNAEQGKFYRPDDDIKIIIHINKTRLPKFEIFVDENNKYRFRLITADGETVIISNEYDHKEDCFKVIELLKDNAIMANTVIT